MTAAGPRSEPVLGSGASPLATARPSRGSLLAEVGPVAPDGDVTAEPPVVVGVDPIGVVEVEVWAVAAVVLVVEVEVGAVVDEVDVDVEVVVVASGSSAVTVTVPSLSAPVSCSSNR
jgi:hypothetical protein